MQYVVFFPKGHKYVSILKQATVPEEQAMLNDKRQLLQSLARQRQQDEAMLAGVDTGPVQLCPSPATEQA